MLELIFQGYIEWAYGMTMECWEYFSAVLLDIMSMDFSYLKTRMPVIEPIMQIMLAVGWALLIGNLIFQAGKTMLSGIGFEGEDPKLLFTRTFVFAFLLLASPQICDLCLNMTSKVIELLEVPTAGNITFADEASFAGLKASWLLVVICGVIVMFQSFKLIFEMAERYLILAVLTITAPLAFGTGGSRNTSDIFSGWCRMYGSMCLLMIMHVVFIKMLLSVLSFYPSGLDVLPWMVLVLATVKVAKKIDSIITRIGLNPAITGDPLGRTFPGGLTYLVMRSASAQITKAIGKSAGGAGKGGSPSVPPGDGGESRGAVFGSGRFAAGGTLARNTTSQQNIARQEATQQSSSYQNSTVQAGEQQTTPQEYKAGPAFSANTQFDQVGASVQGTRKTAVPSGARRSLTQSRTGEGAAVVTGFRGQVRFGTGGSANLISGVAVSTENARNNGPAGSGTASKQSAVQRGEHRTVQPFNQTAREGTARSTVQVNDQKSGPVGQLSGRSVQVGRGKYAGEKPADVPYSGETLARNVVQTERSSVESNQKTRFTRHEVSKQQGMRGPVVPAETKAAPQAAARSKQAAAAVGHGEDERISSARAPRPGRNQGGQTEVPPVSFTQRATAPQERLTATRPTAASGSGTAPGRAPGTAGTVSTAGRAPQSLQIAARGTVHAKPSQNSPVSIARSAEFPQHPRAQSGAIGKVPATERKPSGDQNHGRKR